MDDVVADLIADSQASSCLPAAQAFRIALASDAAPRALSLPSSRVSACLSLDGLAVERLVSSPDPQLCDVVEPVVEVDLLS